MAASQKDGMSKSKVDPYRVFRLRVKVNSLLCVQCGKSIHGRCAGLNAVAPKFSGNFTCRKREGNIVHSTGSGAGRKVM